MEQQQAGVETVQSVDPARYAAVLAFNADRAAVGLNPIPADELDQTLTEFGRLGKGWDRFKDWVKGQINNPEFEKKIKRGEGGRFTEKPRGDLDIEETGRAPRLDLDAVEVADRRWRDKPGRQRQRPASSPPGNGSSLTEVDMEKDVQQLRDAGFTDEQITRWKGRGKVYRADTGTDIPPVYTFIASPDAMIQSATFLQRRDYNEAAKKLAALQRSNPLTTPGLQRRIAAAELDLIRADAALAARTAKVKEAYGSGTEISNWDKDVAEELAMLTADSVRRYYRPEHRTQPFMIELDETQLIRPVAVLNKNRDNPNLTTAKKEQLEQEASQANPFDAMQGLFVEGINLNQTDRGNIISVNRVSARAPLQGPYKEYMAPSGAETIGQDFIRHEPGHGADIRETAWSSEQEIFQPFIEQTRKLFPPGYMEKSQREWFAEMFKVMASGGGNAQQKLAARAFRNMFILHPELSRNIDPPSWWVRANQRWLQKALIAQANGQPIPTMPNPDLKRAFDGFKIPGLITND